MSVKGLSDTFQVSELNLTGQLNRHCLANGTENSSIPAILSSPSTQGLCSWVVAADYHDGGLANNPFQAIIKILDCNRSAPDRSEKLAKAEFSREVTILTRLQHPNIVRYIGSGTAIVSSGEIKDLQTLYYVLERINGLTLDSAVNAFLIKKAEKNSPNSTTQSDAVSQLTQWLEGILEALEYLSDQGVAHLDLHGSNVLIERSGHARLIDFGKALFAGDRYTNNQGESYPTGTTVVGHLAAMYSEAKTYTHPELYSTVANHKDRGTLDTQEFKDDLRRLVGQYHFPRFDLYVVGKLFGDFSARLESHVSRERLPALRALQHLSQQLEKLNAGSKVEFSASDARATVARLKSAVYASQVRHVRLGGRVNVRIPDLARQIVDSKQFQRLRKIKQLALTDLVYPSATHSRFSHSLGAFHMAARYSEAISSTTAEGRVAIGDEEINAIRLGALLHDIGHYPFAHYFEEMHDTRTPFKLGNLDEFTFRHEAIGKYITDAAEQEREDSGSIAIADAQRRVQVLYASKLAAVARGVLASSVDCDKLDYLLRDGHSCGVPYADAIDLKRFLSSLVVISRGPAGELELAVSEKGTAPVESIMIARVHMFTEVYWHKTSRSVASMLKEAMFMATRLHEVDALQLQQLLMSASDTDLLEWLRKMLIQSDNQLAANSLINGIDSRREPHKRVLTLSSAWETTNSSGTASLYTKVISHIESKRALGQPIFMILQDLRNKLVQAGQSFDENIMPWDILLDIPPIEQLTQADEPLIVFNDTKRTMLPLRSVSELLFHADNAGSSTKLSIGAALERARRFRIFASRRILSFPSFDKLKSNQIREYFERWLLDALIKS
jgi:uncharacterized protein